MSCILDFFFWVVSTHMTEKIKTVIVLIVVGHTFLAADVITHHHRKNSYDDSRRDLRHNSVELHKNQNSYRARNKHVSKVVEVVTELSNLVVFPGEEPVKTVAPVSYPQKNKCKDVLLLYEEMYAKQTENQTHNRNHIRRYSEFMQWFTYRFCNFD